MTPMRSPALWFVDVGGAPREQRAIDPSAQFGLRCVVWAWTNIMADVVCGDDVSIGSRTEIGRGTTIGAKSRIGSGVFLPYSSIVGESVFIGPNVTATDDRHPKILSPGQRYTAEPPVIEDHVSIGAGAVILPGVRIGHHAKIAAGAIVAKDVDPHTIVKCAPARVHSPSITAAGWVHG